MTLRKKRLESQPKIPLILKDLLEVSFVAEDSKNHSVELSSYFPETIHLPPHQLV